MDSGPRPLVAYYRVSTPKQGASGLGLEGQVAAVDRFARDRGAEVLRAYREVESDKKADRPELARALANPAPLRRHPGHRQARPAGPQRPLPGRPDGGRSRLRRLSAGIRRRTLARRADDRIFPGRRKISVEKIPISAVSIYPIRDVRNEVAWSVRSFPRHRPLPTNCPEDRESRPRLRTPGAFRGPAARPRHHRLTTHPTATVESTSWPVKARANG
jgi:hypothetical protein